MTPPTSAKVAIQPEREHWLRDDFWSIMLLSGAPAHRYPETHPRSMIHCFSVQAADTLVAGY
jgi:hypothetical protein